MTLSPRPAATTSHCAGRRENSPLEAKRCGVHAASREKDSAFGEPGIEATELDALGGDTQRRRCRELERKSARIAERGNFARPAARAVGAAQACGDVECIRRRLRAQFRHVCVERAVELDACIANVGSPGQR